MFHAYNYHRVKAYVNYSEEQVMNLLSGFRNIPVKKEWLGMDPLLVAQK